MRPQQEDILYFILKLIGIGLLIIFIYYNPIFILLLTIIAGVVSLIRVIPKIKRWINKILKRNKYGN